MDKKGTEIGKRVAYVFFQQMFILTICLFFSKEFNTTKTIFGAYDYGMFKVRQVNGLVKWFYQSYSRH